MSFTLAAAMKGNEVLSALHVVAGDVHIFWKGGLTAWAPRVFVSGKWGTVFEAEMKLLQEIELIALLPYVTTTCVLSVVSLEPR